MNKKSVPVESIQSLSFGYTTGTAYLSNVQYELECSDHCVAKIKPMGVEYENATVVSVDLETVQKIIDILNKYQVMKWDGFDKSDPYVLDGNDFSFSMTVNSDIHVSASGYMMYPKNYSEVKKGLDEIFNSLEV